MALIWNNSLVPEAKRPKTFAEFVALATANEKPWRNKITSYGVHQTTFGYGINYAFAKKHGEKAWQWFAELAKLTPRFERSRTDDEKVIAANMSPGISSRPSPSGRASTIRRAPASWAGASSAMVSRWCCAASRSLRDQKMLTPPS